MALPIPPLNLSAGPAMGSIGSVAGSPVVVNIAGFGSKASGTASSAALPQVTDPFNPGVSVGAGQAAGGPSWLLPALLVGALAWLAMK